MSFHGLKAHFYLVLNSISFSECIAAYLLKDIFIAYKFHQSWTNLLKTSTCLILYWPKFLTPFGKYWRAQLLDCVIKICLVLWETANQSSKMAVQFCIPPATNESSYLSASSPAVVSSVFDFGHPNRWVVGDHGCFHLHFPRYRMWNIFS